MNDYEMDDDSVFVVRLLVEVTGVTNPHGKEADKIVEELTKLAREISQNNLSSIGGVYVSGAWVDDAYLREGV